MDNKAADVPAEPPRYSTGMTPQSILSFGGDKKLRCNWLFVLMFYAGAVSAALIVASIMGAKHINTLEDLCDKSTSGNSNNTGSANWKDYSSAFSEAAVSVLSADSAKQKVYLNTDTNKQMVTDVNGSITVIDFKKGVTGYYDKPSDTCQLSGGVDSKMAGASELADYFTSGSAKASSSEAKVTNSTFKDGDDVQDMSLLPSELQGVCAGKKTTWANQQTTDQDDEAATQAYIHCWNHFLYCTKYYRCGFLRRCRICYYHWHCHIHSG